MTGLPKQAAFDWPLFLVTLALGGMGLWNLASAAHAAEGNLALLQGIWLAAGAVIALILSAIDYRIFDRLAYPLLLGSLVTLLAVLFVGRVISGSRRWIYLGLFNLQPSELTKIALILALAKYFGDEGEVPLRGYTLRDLLKPVTPLYPAGAFMALILFWEKPPLSSVGPWRFLLLGVCLLWAAGSVLLVLRRGRASLHDLVSPVILVALPAVLIMRQPDLGTALVLFAIAGSMILFMGVRLRSTLIAAAVLILAAIAAWHLVLQGYQKDRILAFMSPGVDEMGTGYHARQSIIAVGSGQMGGKGFGESTQTQFHFLPEQHTDFVFSVWAEERGFTGCALAIGLFLLQLVLIINAAAAARERFGQLIGVGMAAMVFWHAAINIGMVTGSLPVVGITLPFWSYGGSSVLANMIGIGLLMSVSWRRHMY